MNTELLKKHTQNFISNSKKGYEKFSKDFEERADLVNYYQQFSKDKIFSMNEEDIYEYLSKLWAMLIWRNKHYVIDKIIGDNGLQNFKKHLTELVWGEQDIIYRWDSFRTQIKGMGPAMISEILCKSHPNDFMIWNRRAYVGFNYLEATRLPKYDYQVTGKVYKYLCNIAKEISKELKNRDFEDSTLLAVDSFIWNELQVEDNLSKIYTNKSKQKSIDEEIPMERFRNCTSYEIENYLVDLELCSEITTNLARKALGHNFDGECPDVIICLNNRCMPICTILANVYFGSKYCIRLAPSLFGEERCYSKVLISNYIVSKKVAVVGDIICENNCLKSISDNIKECNSELLYVLCIKFLANDTHGLPIISLLEREPNERFY